MTLQMAALLGRTEDTLSTRVRLVFSLPYLLLRRVSASCNSFSIASLVCGAVIVKNSSRGSPPPSMAPLSARKPSSVRQRIVAQAKVPRIAQRGLIRRARRLQHVDEALDACIANLIVLQPQVAQARRGALSERVKQRSDARVANVVVAQPQFVQGGQRTSAWL